MKVFMLWDMEGVSGIHSREQVWFWEPTARPEVGQQGKQLLIADVNSAARAALDAGVDELIICDTHHGGGNIVPAQMLSDPRITYLWKSRGEENGKLRWLPGLNDTVDGFMVPGHHAMAGTKNAFLPHTWTLQWADFRINGKSVGEMGIEACFAGHWGIPVAFAEGDETACREARKMFPGIVTARVKKAVGHDACTGPDVEEARALTARGVTEAVERLRAGECKAFQPDLPMTVTISMRTPADAESAARRPGVERVDELTVQYRVERRCDIVSPMFDNTGLP